MIWDEPQAAASPRGWLHFENGEHPHSHKPDFQALQRVNDPPNCCGWYCDYRDTSGYPDLRIMASAYLRGVSDAGLIGTWHARSRYFETVDEAKRWVEAVAREIAAEFRPQFA